MTSDGAAAAGRAATRFAFRLLEGARRLGAGLLPATGWSIGSPERLVDFLRAAADFLWETDGELRLVWLSEPAAAIFGRPLDEVLGRRWSQLAYPVATGALEGIEATDALPGAANFALGRPFRDRRVSLLGGDGRIRTLEISGVPLLGRRGRLAGYRGIAREVSERAWVEARLRFLAAHDPLTGAANRTALAAALRRAIERAARAGYRVALALVDLDGFKQVNDAFGHGAGDQVLRTIVRRLREGLAASDLVARLGGDEFAVLLAEVERPEELPVRLAALERRLSERIVLDATVVSLGASCGLALWPDHGDRLEELLARADLQMYRAKRARRAGTGEPCRAAVEEGQQRRVVPAPG